MWTWKIKNIFVIKTQSLVIIVQERQFSNK